MKMATCRIVAMFNPGILILFKKGKKSLDTVWVHRLESFSSIWRIFSFVVAVDILLWTALLSYCSQQRLQCHFSFVTKRQMLFAHAILLASNLCALTAETWNCHFLKLIIWLLNRWPGTGGDKLTKSQRFRLLLFQLTNTFFINTIVTVFEEATE